MVAFLTCSFPEIDYANSKIQNNPVNLSNVSYIAKGRHAWYPDNLGMCTIEFHMIGKDTEKVIWCFPQARKTRLELDYDNYSSSSRRMKPVDFADPTQRDAEYQSILERFSVNTIQE